MSLTALPKPLGRIVRAETLGLYRDAENILEAARTDAEHIRQSAAEIAERARATRLAEADREARAETAQMLAETAARTQRAIAGLSEEIAGAIADATAKIIGDLDPSEAIAAASRRAIADLVDRNAVTIRVARTHVDRVRVILAAWGQAATVVGDEAVTEDACVIETRAGFVRAGLSEQLALLRQALLQDAETGFQPYDHD